MLKSFLFHLKQLKVIVLLILFFESCDEVLTDPLLLSLRQTTEDVLDHSLVLFESPNIAHFEIRDYPGFIYRLCPSGQRASIGESICLRDGSSAGRGVGASGNTLQPIVMLHAQLRVDVQMRHHSNLLFPQLDQF